MDIRPRNLSSRYPRKSCVFLSNRDCGFVSRRKTIFHPQRSTRISLKDFYRATVPAATIPPKVASHSTSSSAGVATKRRGDMRNQRQEEDFENADGLDTRKIESSYLENLIKRSCKIRNFNEGLYFLKRMVSAGHVPSTALGTQLINGFSSYAGSSDQSAACAISKAQEVMEILENHGSQDTDAYNCLLTMICMENKFSSAEHVKGSLITVLDRMQAHGCYPNLRTYHILIGALCRDGQLEVTMEVVDQMLLQDQCQPVLIAYIILIVASFRGTRDDNENDEGNGGGITRVIKLLEEMAAKGLQLDNRSYNCILRGMCNHGFVDQAWQLMRTLNSNHPPSDSSSFKPKLAPDVVLYNILLRGLLDMSRGEDAEKQVSEMVPTGQCRVNVKSPSMLINSLCMQGMVDKAVKVLDDMMDGGLKPDTYSYDPIVAAYCKQGRTDLAITFMDHILSRGYATDIVNYNTILSSLCRSGAAYQALEVLDKLETMGYHPNTSSYNIFIAVFWFNGDRTKAVKMMSQMLDKGLYPDEITYNTIISGLCRDGMVYFAIELMADMENTLGFIPNWITYNTIILGLCKVHDIDAAIDIFEEMIERRCMPNESTYMMLVVGLTKAGHIEEAIKVGTELLSCNAISRNKTRRLENLFRCKIPTLK